MVSDAYIACVFCMTNQASTGTAVFSIDVDHHPFVTSTKYLVSTTKLLLLQLLRSMRLKRSRTTRSNAASAAADAVDVRNVCALIAFEYVNK